MTKAFEDGADIPGFTLSKQQERDARQRDRNDGGNSSGRGGKKGGGKRSFKPNKGKDGKPPKKYGPPRHKGKNKKKR
jgi:hypothetical protein